MGSREELQLPAMKLMIERKSFSRQPNIRFEKRWFTERQLPCQFLPFEIPQFYFGYFGIWFRSSANMEEIYLRV
jgi:hypothetical protein